MNIKEIKLVCPEIKHWYFTEEPSRNPFALGAVLWGEVSGVRSLKMAPTFIRAALDILQEKMKTRFS